MFRLGVEGLAEMRKKVVAVKPMDFTGKVMKGWAQVEGSSVSDEELQELAKAAFAFAGGLPAKG